MTTISRLGSTLARRLITPRKLGALGGTHRYASGMTNAPIGENKNEIRGEEVHLFSDYLKYSNALGEQALMNYAWLRDHCECDQCVHPKTKQKLHDTRTHGNTQIKKAEVSGGQLSLEWADAHLSRFNTEKLADSLLLQSVLKTKPTLWNSRDMKKIKFADIEHKDYMADDAWARKLLSDVFQYGVGFVKNAPCTSDVSEQSVERLGPIMTTHEGTCTVLGKGIIHDDISYSTSTLPMHTDMPYLKDPPGLSLLHCLEKKCTGGSTFFVDGFKIATDLRKDKPEAYKALVEGPRRFGHDGINITGVFPMVTLDHKTGELEMIRYGSLYTKELIVPQTEAQKYYDALKLFDEKVHSSEYQFAVTLEDGDQVLFNNRRMIHGRGVCEGTRLIAGVNLNMDYAFATAKRLGL